MNRIFLLAGRTGGPILPLLAISKNLPNTQPIIIGIQGGYEEQVARNYQLPILFLPEVKLRPFPQFSLWSQLVYLIELFGNFWLLLYACIVSLWFLHKYQPIAVFSAGSFLAVPMLYATKIYNFWHIPKVQIVIHQQDPVPGLANKLTLALADIKTYVFDLSVQLEPKLLEAWKIPNPLDLDGFQPETLLATASQITSQKPELDQFFRFLEKSKPVFLIFGGASGAEAINDWVISNLEHLTRRFNVLHLTGSLQRKHYQKVHSKNYLSLSELLDKEMKLALNLADVVLCRAGLNSISELLYLQKPAYLVPIPKSHQEVNAQVVKEYFYILEQENMPQWIEIIYTTYPHFFHNTNYPSREEIRQKLDIYYQRLQKFLKL